MAVTGDEEVNRILLQRGIILRVMAKEHLVTRQITKAPEELCVHLTCDLLGWYASEKYVLDFHSTVVQERNIRILEDRFIIPCQIQFMVAKAHHQRGNLAGFQGEIIRVLFATVVLLPPAKSSQAIRYADDAAK